MSGDSVPAALVLQRLDQQDEWLQQIVKSPALQLDKEDVLFIQNARRGNDLATSIKTDVTAQVQGQRATFWGNVRQYGVQFAVVGALTFIWTHLPAGLPFQAQDFHRHFTNH